VSRSFEELVINVLGTDNILKIELVQSSTAESYAEICALAALKALKLAMDDVEKPASSSSESKPPRLRHDPEMRWIDIPEGRSDPTQGLEMRVLDQRPVILE